MRVGRRDRPSNVAAMTVPHAPTSIDLSDVGDWRATIADEELRRRYPDTDYDDRAWDAVTVPGHWRGEAAFADHDGPLLYRTRFSSPGAFGAGAERAADADEPRRTWLTLDGVFYTSDVWLDGSYLGDTEGYFFPHTFEVSDAIAAQTEHTLALEVSCRPEADRTAKRQLTGVFQHWDLRDQDDNPGGIWRPVRLEQTGAVRIAHLRVLCRDASPASATVFIRAVLDTVEARTVELVTRLVPRGGSASDAVEHAQRQPLAAGENRVEWTHTVADPALWWPHALGDQPLYDLAVEVRVHGAAETGDRPELVSDRRVRSIGLRSIGFDDWIFSVNGERLYLKGSNQGPTRMALADATPAELAHDIALAKDANLDFLRVHAHVSRPELYDAADAAGLLLWQDMPLQWGYHRSVRRQARRQARELVDLLAHHPSVFVWCGHNEPLAIDVDPAALARPRARAKLAAQALAGQVLPTWNKSVLDHSVRAVIDKADGSRPVIPHSGVFPHPPQFDGTDTHSYLGWYYGDERSFPALLRAWPRLGRFVTEFGAQAVPEDASFLEPERWPDLDWERAARTHALQKAFLDHHAPAASFATFDEWKVATQTYQASVIKHHIEALRRLKYRPGGGFAQFCFADGHPSVTWSVLGHDRQAKLGWAALTEACAPVIIVADRLPAAVHPGDRLTLDLHVISDARIAHLDMVASAHLSCGDPRSGPATTSWSWHGDIPADSCCLVGTLDTIVPPGDGPVVLDLEVQGEGLAISNRYVVA